MIFILLIEVTTLVYSNVASKKDKTNNYFNLPIFLLLVEAKLSFAYFIPKSKKMLNHIAISKSVLLSVGGSGHVIWVLGLVRLYFCLDQLKPKPASL